jgi:hypothetical protein
VKINQTALALNSLNVSLLEMFLYSYVYVYVDVDDKNHYSTKRGYLPSIEKKIW